MRNCTMMTPDERKAADEKALRMEKLCGDVYRENSKIALWLPDELLFSAPRLAEKINRCELKISLIVSDTPLSEFNKHHLSDVMSDSYEIMTIDEVLASTEIASDYCIVHPPLDKILAADEKCLTDFLRLYRNIPLGLALRGCWQNKIKGVKLDV